MRKDSGNQSTQVFAPHFIRAASTTYTPDSDHLAIAPATDCSYAIDGGTSVELPAGSIRGVWPDITYTFTPATALEVMKC